MSVNKYMEYKTLNKWGKSPLYGCSYFSGINLLVLYIHACPSDAKTNYSVLECGLQQMSCNLFPEIGTNKQMAVIIRRVHCLMVHKSRALMGRGRLQKRPRWMLSWGDEKGGREAMTPWRGLLHTNISCLCQQHMYLCFTLNVRV